MRGRWKSWQLYFLLQHHLPPDDYKRLFPLVSKSSLCTNNVINSLWDKNWKYNSFADRRMLSSDTTHLFQLRLYYKAEVQLRYRSYALGTTIVTSPGTNYWWYFPFTLLWHASLLDWPSSVEPSSHYCKFSTTNNWVFTVVRVSVWCAQYALHIHALIRKMTSVWAFWTLRE